MSMALAVTTALCAAAVGETVGKVIVEALVDTTTDFVIDGINDTMTKVMPNFENSYMKQFTNQVRMGMSSATNARIMAHALKSQNKIEEKIQSEKERISEKYKGEYERIKYEGGLKHIGRGKRLKDLDNKYYKAIDELEKDGTRNYRLRQSAATEAAAFSNGTGALKQGHDGTIQNLKGGANADLTQAIYALLNGMGHSPDKRGINNISPSGGVTA